MGSLNRVMLVGRLGKDPECRTVQGGTQMATFSVATSDRYKDKSGQYQETTEWHRVVVWGQQADFATKYLQKGRQVYVEGRLETRTWTDKTGAERSTTQIVARDLQALDKSPSKSGGAEVGRTSWGSHSAPAGPTSVNQPASTGLFDDDDIPF
jgi:single-strand DNA-binding protein